MKGRMKNVSNQLFQSFVNHYQETGDKTGYVSHLVECGFHADDIAKAFHKFHDWLEEKEEKSHVKNTGTDI